MNRRTLIQSSVLAAAGAALPSVGRWVPAGLAQEATPCPPGTPAEETALARRFLEEAMNGRDLSVFDAILAPNVVYHAATVDDSTDIASVKATYQTLLDGFSDLKYEIGPTVAEGNEAAYAYTATGTNDGAFRGNPATGKVITWTGNLYVRTECGKIVEAWNAIDQLARLQQLGLVAVPAGMPDKAGEMSATAATAVAATPAGTPAACDTSRDATVAAARAFWDAGLNKGDLDAAAAMMDPALMYHRPIGVDIVGTEAAMAWIAERRRFMPDLTVTYDSLIVEGDMVAGRWTATGTDTGGTMGLPPTGKRATWSGIGIYEVTCGKITELWMEGDFAGLLGQIGITLNAPAPAATPAP